MAIQPINVGNVVNDGSGDDLRTAFVKVNNNFVELDIRHGEQNIASNVGTGTGLYKDKVGVNLEFKSINAGTGINLVSDANTITISNSDDPLLNQINTLLNTYDFGKIRNNQINNVIDIILQSILVDFGSITAPGSINLDGGTLV